MKNYPKINKVYQLAGISFESPWKCLTVSASRSVAGHTQAIMQNQNTGEIRSCSNPEINEAGEIFWSSSKDLDESFTIEVYDHKGNYKQTIKRICWNHVLHLWKGEILRGYPAPTIWLGGNRLVDGPILLESLEG